MPDQEPFKTRLIFQRDVPTEDVVGEARERLRYLRTKNETSGINDKEWEEINHILTAHLGKPGIVVVPDLDMLGVTDHEKFVQRFGSIHSDAEAAYDALFFLEAISLRMLTLDFLLRAHIVHRTKRPVPAKPKPTFGQLIKMAKGQGFRQAVAADLEAFNIRRNEGVHNYLLGRGSYQALGDAYRDADGLFEEIVEVIDLPPFVAE
jgi:hypothetical protein